MILNVAEGAQYGESSPEPPVRGHPFTWQTIDNDLSPIQIYWDIFPVLKRTEKALEASCTKA